MPVITVFPCHDAIHVIVPPDQLMLSPNAFATASAPEIEEGMNLSFLLEIKPSRPGWFEIKIQNRVSVKTVRDTRTDTAAAPEAVVSS